MYTACFTLMWMQILIFSEWFINFFFLSRNGSQEREENGQKREVGQIRSKFMVRLELIIPPTILFSCTRECSSCFYLHSSFRRILIMPSQPLKHGGMSLFLKWGSLPFGGHLVMSGDIFGYHSGQGKCYRHPEGVTKNAAKSATKHRTALPQQRVILLQMSTLWKLKNPGLSNHRKLAM